MSQPSAPPQPPQQPQPQPSPASRPALSIVEPGRSIDSLGAEIVAHSGRLAAATCRWLLLVAEFDVREGWRAFGLPSTARWLAHACGLADRTSTDHVRVARALAAHPPLVDEMSAGRLSYSHVRSISRVATVDEPRLVDELVNVAEHGTVHQLESVVRGLRTVRDNEAGVAPAESLTFGWTAAGQWRLSGRFDPERGAVVESAIRRVARAGDISQTEALIRLAEIGLAALADGQPAPRDLRGDERAAVVIHLDATQVPGPVAPPAANAAPIGSAEPIGDRPGPSARLANDGPGLPAAVVERLLCSGRVRTAVREGEKPGGDVLALGRTRRLVSDRQFRALMLRHDGHCVHPGCRSKARLEAHHVRHWLHGGRTEMANLVLLCEWHHHGHHEGEFSIEPVGRGRFRFRRADGAELLPHADTDLLTTDGAPDPADEQVSATAAAGRWDGRRLERDYAVGVLARHLKPPA